MKNKIITAQEVERQKQLYREAIKEARLKTGKTQEQFCKMLGLKSPSSYRAMYESGSKGTLEQLMQFYHDKIKKLIV